MPHHGLTASGAAAQECGGSVSTIRVGIVGAGWIAREHRRVLDSVAEAELVAVCDTASAPKPWPPAPAREPT